MTAQHPSTELTAIDCLEQLIEGHLNGRVRDFRLLVLHDGLILLGRTSTYHSKQLAQHVTMKASKLPILANDIEVVQLG